jgi:hypothetical protein
MLHRRRCRCGRWTHFGYEGRLYIKIDVQGAEADVLAGASRTLAFCRAIEIELCTVPLYQGQALLPELWHGLYEGGFRAVSLAPAFRTPQPASCSRSTVSLSEVAVGPRRSARTRMTDLWGHHLWHRSDDLPRSRPRPPRVPQEENASRQRKRQSNPTRVNA